MHSIIQLSLSVDVLVDVLTIDRIFGAAYPTRVASEVAGVGQGKVGGADVGDVEGSLDLCKRLLSVVKDHDVLL